MFSFNFALLCLLFCHVLPKNESIMGEMKESTENARKKWRPRADDFWRQWKKLRWRVVSCWLIWTFLNLQLRACCACGIAKITPIYSTELFLLLTWFSPYLVKSRGQKGEFEPPTCIRSKQDTKFGGFSPLTFFSNFFFHPHGICPFQGFRGYSYCKLLQRFQRLPLTRTNLVQLRTKEIKTRDERGQRFCGDWKLLYQALELFFEKHLFPNLLLRSRVTPKKPVFFGL